MRYSSSAASSTQLKTDGKQQCTRQTAQALSPFSLVPAPTPERHGSTDKGENQYTAQDSTGAAMLDICRGIVPGCLCMQGTADSLAVRTERRADLWRAARHCRSRGPWRCAQLPDSLLPALSPACISHNQGLHKQHQIGSGGLLEVTQLL